MEHPTTGACSDVKATAASQMKEGQIEEGSAAWEAMSAADRTKRKRAAAESKTKLKSPNFFVSRTRLCLRNLPHQISEKALKDLVVAAVRRVLFIFCLPCHVFASQPCEPAVPVTLIICHVFQTRWYLLQTHVPPEQKHNSKEHPLKMLQRCVSKGEHEA